MDTDEMITDEMILEKISIYEKEKLNLKHMKSEYETKYKTQTESLEMLMMKRNIKDGEINVDSTQKEIECTQELISQCEQNIDSIQEKVDELIDFIKYYH